jgi:putative ATPase
MAPRTLKEVVGQGHLLGPGKLLRRLIEADRVTSIILYGPPGSGKTSLGGVIAARTHSHFERLNATAAGVSDLRRVMQTASMRLREKGTRTILFLDEIHRLNRLQQDVLLPAVEEAAIALIGATIHNPFFTVTSALISRSQVFELAPLSTDELREVLRRARQDPERGLGNLPLEVTPEAEDHLLASADGDARRLLNALEVGALTTPPGESGTICIDLAAAEDSVQRKALRYDAAGDQHYDTVSAFIKSMRGSDPDAALYYLNKMLAAGEDLRFIARRIVIFAAEDIGNADPQALVLACATLQAVEFVGLPEARLPLAQATIYLACAPKSNSTLVGLDSAAKDLKEKPTAEIPPHLREGGHPGAARLGHGSEYQYPHDHPDAFVEQSYLLLPGPHTGRYYRPSDRGFEKTIRERLENLRASKKQDEPESRSTQ